MSQDAGAPEEVRFPELAFAKPKYVFCRGLANSYAAEALQMGGANVIDLALARRQHASIVEKMKELGIAVVDVPVDEGCADCVFIEDPAIVLSPESIVTTCPGAPSRRPEVAGVRAALEKCGIERIRAMPILSPDVPGGELASSGTIDGGDVMRVGRTFFVGLSTRSSSGGVAWLREQLAEEGFQVVPVAVKGGLHLKSAATVLDEKTLLVLKGQLDLEPLKQARLTIHEVEEPAGANVLAFGRQIVMSAAAPKTIELVRSLGFEVHILDISEVHKADGALTCLSLRVPPQGGWCI